MFIIISCSCIASNIRDAESLAMKGMIFHGWSISWSKGPTFFVSLSTCSAESTWSNCTSDRRKWKCPNQGEARKNDSCRAKERD
ncbi:Secondary metabolism regulator laeA [Fusarium oxysporum f. sp. albedinis]|nr:Secondary metabolism regulator laeA [Fusarium oxysporum f. sp. albedinis]